MCQRIALKFELKVAATYHGNPEADNKTSDNLKAGMINETHSQELLPGDAGIGLELNFDVGHDASLRFLDLLGIKFLIVKLAECVIAIFVSVPGEVPSRRIGEEEGDKACWDGESTLENDGNAPTGLMAPINETVVDPLHTG